MTRRSTTRGRPVRPPDPDTTEPSPAPSQDCGSFTTLAPIIEAAVACPDEHAIRALCDRFTAAIDHHGWLLACTLTHLSVDAHIPLVSFSGYPRQWLDTYNQRGYIDHDPVVRAGLMITYPFEWSELGQRPPDTFRMFEEAARYGIADGFSAPLTGPRKSKGLFNISRRLSGLPPAPARFRHHAATLLFGTRLMESVVRVADRIVTEFGDVADQLDPAQRRLLAALSSGAEPSGLAARLDLTAAQVDRQLRRLLTLFRCQSVDELLARNSFLQPLRPEG